MKARPSSRLVQSSRRVALRAREKAGARSLTAVCLPLEQMSQVPEIVGECRGPRTAHFIELFVEARSKDLRIVLPGGTDEAEWKTQHARRAYPADPRDMKRDDQWESDDVEADAKHKADEEERQPDQEE